MTPQRKRTLPPSMSDRRMSFTEADHVYVSRDGSDLLALVYRPDIADTRPVSLVIDVHGGAWSSGHRKSGRHYDRKLAAAGICVVSIDFRQGPDHKHPAAAEDILAAIEWCLELDIPRSSLGLIGSSSGGHLATYTAIGANDLTPNTDVLEEVDYVIALWPVSNPIARYQYVKARMNEEPVPGVRFHPKQLFAGHEAYFTSPAQMTEAAIQDILLHGRFVHLPSLFIVQPELDQNVPVMMSQTFKGAWELAGGDVLYRLYEGVGHAFAHLESEQSDRCIEDMIRFIVDR